MNVAVKSFDDNDAAYDVSFRSAGAPSATRTTRTDKAFGRRRGKAPQQFNGIHRRRVKKIRW